jgi:hypothetical protein
MMRLDSIGIEIGAATAQGLPRANPVVALLGAAATLVLAQQAGAAAATATSPLIGHLDSVTVATGEVVLHWWAADLITPQSQPTSGTPSAQRRRASGSPRTRGPMLVWHTRAWAMDTDSTCPCTNRWADMWWM